MKHLAEKWSADYLSQLSSEGNVQVSHSIDETRLGRDSDVQGTFAKESLELSHGRRSPNTS